MGYVLEDGTPVDPSQVASSSGRPTNDLAELVARSEMSPGVGAARALTGGAYKIGNDLTLGFLDEASSGTNALLDRLQYGTPVSEAYDQRLAQSRELQKQFEDTAYNTFGHFPINTAMSVGAGIAATPGKLVNLLKAAPIKTGGVLTGLAGFGNSEGGVWDRAIGGGFGALLGMGIPAAINTGAWGAKKGLTSDAFLNAKDYLSNKLSGAKGLFGPLGERGAIGESATEPILQETTKLLPRQVSLLERLKGTNPEKLTSAEGYLQTAIDEGSPVTLTEALNDPNIYRQSRALANYQPVMSQVGEFIEPRAREAGSRITKIANDIAPDQSAFLGGKSLKEGADLTDQALRSARRAIANPLYEDAFASKPLLKSKETFRVLDHPDIAPSVEDARRVLAFRKDTTVQKINPRSTEVANEVLAELSSKARSIKYQKGDKASLNMDEAYQALKKAIYKEVPKLKTARDTYEQISVKLKEKTGAGIVDAVKKLGEGDFETAGEKLLRNPESQLRKVRQTFAEAGQKKALRDGVRAYVQNIVDVNSSEYTNNKDLVARILGKGQDRKIRALLGDHEAEDIFRKLAREQRIFKGSQMLNPQSGTAGNLAEADQLKAQPNIIGKAYGYLRHAGQTLDNVVAKFTEQPVDERLASDLARTYITDPKQGLLDLRSIMPIQGGRYPFINRTVTMADLLRDTANTGAPFTTPGLMSGGKDILGGE